MKKIAIVGLDGSGKSTLASNLFKSLDNFKIVSVWDNLESLEISKSTIHNYIKALSPEARFLFIYHSLLHTTQIHKSINLIIDSSWYKYAAIENAIDKDCINKYIPSLIKADIIFYLNIGPGEITKRKNDFTPHELGPTDEGFISFQRKVEVELKSILALEKNVIELNGNLSPDEIAETAKGYLS